MKNNQKSTTFFAELQHKICFSDEQVKKHSEAAFYASEF